MKGKLRGLGGLGELGGLGMSGGGALTGRNVPGLDKGRAEPLQLFSKWKQLANRYKA